MPRNDIFLLRHGQSTWNVERRVQGHGDPPLTELGRVQAQASALTLKGLGIGRVIASDLARARETACIVAQFLGVSVHLDPAWRERDVGCWTGMTRGEIRARWPDSDARRDLLGSPQIGGEDGAVFEWRVRAALGAVRADACEAAPTLVVTHRRVIKSLAPALKPANGEIVPLSRGDN